jgi:hypothetical protein
MRRYRVGQSIGSVFGKITVARLSRCPARKVNIVVKHRSPTGEASFDDGDWRIIPSRHLGGERAYPPLAFRRNSLRALVSAEQAANNGSPGNGNCWVFFAMLAHHASL